MRRSMLIKVAMTSIVLGAVMPRMAAADDITGVLVDSACYAAYGAKATTSDHLKCAQTCAQRGQRLAVVTAKGLVYMVTGIYTQANSAKLIPLLNQQAVFTGTVSVRVPAPVPAPVTKDTRRPTVSPDAVVTTTVRTGDFQEGDVVNASETTLEVSSIAAVPPIKIQ